MYIACLETYRDADDGDCEEEEVDVGSNRFYTYRPNLCYHDGSDGATRGREVQSTSTYGCRKDLRESQYFCGPKYP